ncbi:MAG: T9SS type A sorting domain-containing protein, partial [Saprospiraceae bacterium]
DITWNTVDENQQYRYAVETIYTNGISEVTFSNIIDGDIVAVNDLFDVAQQVKVYPNPTSGFVTITIEPGSRLIGPIQVYDALGQLLEYIETDSILNNTIISDFSTYQSGAYWLKMQLNGQTVSKLIVKK